MFELNSNNVKKILIIATYIILLCFILLNINVVFKALAYILALLKPFIYGFAFAFILNIPLSKFEDRFTKKNERKKGKNASKKEKRGLIRAIGIILSLIIFLGIIFLTLFLVIPEFINTIDIFKQNIPEAFSRFQTWLTNMMSNYPGIMEKISAIKPNWQQIESNLGTFIKNAATGIIGVSIDFVVSVFSGVINVFIGFVFAIYMLIQKENLIRQLKKIVRKCLSEKSADNLIRLASFTNSVFKKFFGGQFLEALILGVLCFIGMTIFRMEYALTISVLIGVTALIPVFGAFIGTIIGAILILAVNPVHAFWFVVFIVVLQQIDGNLIYPRIIGGSVGLPAIWVMLSVIVGGNGFGIIGMLVAVPLASVIYAIIKDTVNEKKIVNMQK